MKSHAEQTSIELARREFLELIREHTPALDELSGEVFQLYQESGIVDPLTQSAWLSLVEGRKECDNLLMKKLRASLLDWQSRWHLNEAEARSKWCLATAVVTLAKWNISAPHRKNLWWHYPHYMKTERSPSSIIKREFPDYLFSYFHSGKPRERYIEERKREALELLDKMSLSSLSKAQRGRIVRDVGKAVESYCIKVEQSQEPDNLEPAALMPNCKHLKWAVDFQLNKQPYNHIAGGADVTPVVARREVLKILASIGLRARDVRRGRGRGSKDSVPRRRASS